MKPPRILVVDDDDHVRAALVDELSERYRVESVASGGEAFDALAMHQYDVIISDLKMPDHDGIEVLEFARRHQRDAVRVLLTGYLDERAQRALMRPDAPYKVGKPWHDEIEIVVQRGLEQRELARRLSASVGDALSLATLDDELAATRTPIELSETVVRRALAVEGVMACATIVRSASGEHPFTGGSVPPDGPGWLVDLPLDVEGDLRLRARVLSDGARQLVHYMAHRAQRACGTLEARVAPVHAPPGAPPTRMTRLMRQATIGALTSSLLHDLASTMQALTAALNDITAFAESEPAQLAEALAEAEAAGDEIVQLFVHTRRFIRDGEVARRPVSIDKLFVRARKLVGGLLRERATLRIAAAPGIEVVASEALFLHVVANLLRNAASASPPGGAIDVEVRATDTDVAIVVTDDGPGVPPAIADQMFEPLANTLDEGGGLGLAISAYVMQMLGGRISYRKEPSRGAQFRVSLPRATSAVPPPSTDEEP